MNPAAVERMAQMTGGYGRIVWMDSFDSEAQVPQYFVAMHLSSLILHS
jgi:hypothetical protein